MEPQVQYATTADGVRIAYYVMGEGPPLVFASNIWGDHLLLRRKISRLRQIEETWERRYRVVRYDARGAGLSQRESPDFSLSSRLLDLEAVVDSVQLGLFTLFAYGNGGLAAVAYAVRHRERVTRLILDRAHASGRDFFAASPSLRARATLRPATSDEWEFYTLTFATEVVRTDPERAKELAALFRASMEPDAMVAFRDGMVDLDVTDLLPQIPMPTLVLSRPSREDVQPELSQVLAARIPGARLVVLEPLTFTVSDDEERLRVVAEFLGDAALADETAEPATLRVETSAFRTILFTDMVGHTEMMQRLGDARGRLVLREHERITRDTLERHGGVEVKTDGDSFMASFTSATRAVECAVALQRAFAAHNETSDEPILIRAGLNIGEPIEEEGPDGRADFFGSAVILGARIKDQAGAGEILIPEAMRHMLSGKKFLFADRGELVLKGFEDAVRLFEVRWRRSPEAD